ncbi:MAG: ATP-binding protein [Ekhidna sp.]
MIRILLAFALGVSVVLVIAFTSNRQIQNLAEVSAELDETISLCGKQRTLSQYLTKYALILETDTKKPEVAISHLDSALALFNRNHQQIEVSNRQLATYAIDISEAEQLYKEVTPAISAFIRNSYGIQEAANMEAFRANILKHEETFLPAMNQLSDSYQKLSMEMNNRLTSTIASQYWMMGITVVLAASLVLIFTIQLVRVRVNRQRTHFTAIIESKEKYENLVRGTHDIIYELNRVGEFVYINPAFEKCIGYNLAEIKRKKWFEYIVPEHRKEIVEFYDEVVKNRAKEIYIEIPFLTANGEKKWVGQSTDFSISDEGEIDHIYNVAKDITELKSAVTKEEKYKDGLMLLNDLHAPSELSIHERLERGLKLCSEFLGLEAGIISSIWMDEYRIEAFYPQESGLEINQKFKLGNTYCDITIAQKGRVIGIDNMKKSEHKNHPCFENFKLESYVGAAYRVNGKVSGTVNFTSVKARKEPFTDYEIDFISLVAKWVGGLMDIRENSSKIQEEQDLLKTFISSAPAAIVMLDKHMNYISASKRWYKEQNIVGDIIGKSHYKVFPDISIEVKEMYQKALDGDIVKSGIELNTRADGTTQWMQGEIHPWYTGKDKVGGIIIFANDLTEIKRQEVELREAKEEAEKASSIKEQFLSTMSHEIRTPLNAIIGTTNLLEMEHPELEGSNRLRMLKFGSNNLLTLINDILDFQKIESGNLEIVTEDINLHELGENIIETWKSVPKQGDVQLSYHYSNSLPDHFLCDEVRLTQVLNNLISNALKFTEEGEVELKVIPGGEEIVQFVIKDTGIGIPEDKQETIFETFKQVNSSRTSKAGGTGLGLSISKHLVDLMGGKLEVSSRENEGTSFYFSVPLGISSTKTSRKKKVKARNAQLDLKILLVEDNKANQEIAKGFLNRWGIRVDVANDGEEALEKVVSKAYDLMIIDVRMPVMDGYEATRRIRSMEDVYFRRLPIIALTASTLLESRSKMEESGMDEIVSKPFDPDDLFEKVSRLGKKSIRMTSDQKESQIPSDRIDKPFAFLSELLGGDEEKVRMIADMAMKSINEGIDGVRSEEEANRNREKAYDHLHKMKSNLANLDLQPLALQMPDYRSENFWEDIPDFISRVEKEMAKLAKYQLESEGVSS